MSDLSRVNRFGENWDLRVRAMLISAKVEVFRSRLAAERMRIQPDEVQLGGERVFKDHYHEIEREDLCVNLKDGE